MLRSAQWARSWTIARAAASLLILAGIIAQAAQTIGGAIAKGQDVGTVAVNFFSFFTILSNCGACVVLAWAVVWFWTKGMDAAAQPRGLTLALTCVSTYMIITGVVYNALLRSVELPQGTTVWWSNEVLHLIGPLFLLADVFVGALPRRLGWSAIGGVLAFPLVWVVYTMLRGENVVNPVTGELWWYPYPFLNPHLIGGAVWLYVAGIAVAIGVVAAGVVWVGRARSQAAARQSALTGAP